MSSTFSTQLRHLARRSVVRTLRDPGMVAPAVMIPLLLFGIVASGLGAAKNIPGFPTDNFTSFALTIAFAQGAMVTISNSGGAIATDIETRFINRLALTPMSAPALLVAQLAGTLALGLVQAAAYFAVGLAAGARVEAGVLGAVVLVILFLLMVFAFGAFGLFVGLRTASGQAVQGIAPLMLVFLFLSSVNFPRNLIETDWFRYITNANPISYLVEGMRSLLITGWDGRALVLGFGVAFALSAVMLAAAAGSLKGRMVRT